MKRAKVIMLALSSVAAIAAGVYSMTSTAAYAYMTETYYYSDAAKTNEVGYRFRNCNGATYTEGTVTTYKTIYREPCGGGYPR